MTTKREVLIMRMLRGAWVVAFNTQVVTLAALAAIYFIFPAVAHAVGVAEAVEGAYGMAGVIESSADGSIERLLVMAVIISNIVIMALVLIILRLVSKPCLLTGEQGQSVMRDVLWGIWRRVKSQ